MAQQPLKTIVDSIEVTITGVDFIEENEGTVTFTIMWGGVSKDGYKETYEGIETFTKKNDVGVKLVSTDGSHSTYEVIENGDEFEWSMDDVYV